MAVANSTSTVSGASSCGTKSGLGQFGCYALAIKNAITSAPDGVYLLDRMRSTRLLQSMPRKRDEHRELREHLRRHDLLRQGWLLRRLHQERDEHRELRKQLRNDRPSVYGVRDVGDAARCVLPRLHGERDEHGELRQHLRPLTRDRLRLAAGAKGGAGPGGQAGAGPGTAGNGGTIGPEGKALNTLAL